VNIYGRNHETRGGNVKALIFFLTDPAVEIEVTKNEKKKPKKERKRGKIRQDKKKKEVKKE
jgi:hypothetical protein